MPAGSRRSIGRVLVSALVVPVAFGVLANIAVPVASAAKKAAAPPFQMPFACGEDWNGSTRPSHTPSPLAIDWNRNAYDEGHIVAASAPGYVASVINLGDRSYGLYIVIDHGHGWSTLYAHLDAAFVADGQWVDQGQTIGLLGDSGDATGPHLHFEQRLNKTDQHAVFDGTPFKYNSWLTSRDCPDVPIVGDWNGDRFSDVGIFRRHRGAGMFRERMPDGTLEKFRFGLPSDQPLVGDWNGDGESDIGVWRTAHHQFVLRYPDGSLDRFSFGSNGDIGLAGDWDDSGTTEVGVWEPATSTFYLRDASGAFSSETFGSPGDVPITGDWNGDGRTDVGVYDPATSIFSLAMPDGTTTSITFGAPGDMPVIGNWNTDATSDLGVWDPSTGIFDERLGPDRSLTLRFGHLR